MTSVTELKANDKVKFTVQGEVSIKTVKAIGELTGMYVIEFTDGTKIKKNYTAQFKVIN